MLVVPRSPCRTSAARSRFSETAAGPCRGACPDFSLSMPACTMRGSHIVVRKAFEGDHAYIFQHTDGRILFAIPYERDFTLIGTTDVEHEGAPGRVAIEEDEVRYLCESANRYFEQSIGPDDVVWSYSHVSKQQITPLVGDSGAYMSGVTHVAESGTIIGALNGVNGFVGGGTVGNLFF